jgi:hypothetical protein
MVLSEPAAVVARSRYTKTRKKMYALSALSYLFFSRDSVAESESSSFEKLDSPAAAFSGHRKDREGGGFVQEQRGDDSLFCFLTGLCEASWMTTCP